MMARLAILLCLLALAAVLVSGVSGALTSLGITTIRGHFEIAVPATILALFAWTLVVLYFVGAVAWVAEAVDGGGHPRFLTRARAMRRLALTWPIAATAALSIAYMLGGAADAGSLPRILHLALALIAAGAHLVAAYRTVVLVGMMLDLQSGIGRDPPAAD